MLECVVNISEGRDTALLDELASACDPDLVDVHRDPHHNRSVFTLVGVDAPRRLATAAIERIDLGTHVGVHPRIGAIDVVPFVPLRGASIDEAIRARDGFCDWAGRELALPCFRYGPERSLPQIRRDAFGDLAPDCGPHVPHPTAGGCAVGARPLLVAYNVWVSAPDLASVGRVARRVRGPSVRTLGLQVGDRFQVSCNLVEPQGFGPVDVVAAVHREGLADGVEVDGTELVGLIPRSVLDQIDPIDWERLDVGPDRTIEARLAQRERC